MSLTGGNRNDVTQLLPLLDKIPAVAGPDAGPMRSSPTAATTTTSTGACYGGAASAR